MMLETFMLTCIVNRNWFQYRSQFGAEQTTTITVAHSHLHEPALHQCLLQPLQGFALSVGMDSFQEYFDFVQFAFDGRFFDEYARFVGEC